MSTEPITHGEAEEPITNNIPPVVIMHNAPNYTQSNISQPSTIASAQHTNIDNMNYQQVPMQVNPTNTPIRVIVVTNPVIPVQNNPYVIQAPSHPAVIVNPLQRQTELQGLAPAHSQTNSQNKPNSSQYPGAVSLTTATKPASSPSNASAVVTIKPVSSSYPGAAPNSAATLAPHDKKARYRCCKRCIVFLSMIILAIVIVVYVRHINGLNVDLDCSTTELGWNDVPRAGKSFQFCQGYLTQSISMNKKTKIFEPESTLKCIIEFDEEGELNTDDSYIELASTYSESLEVGDILLQTSDIFEEVHTNCTFAPAVVITNISSGNDGILTLRIREADMFEYIDEMDVNITNATTYAAGINIGRIKQLKKMAEYFSNRTETQWFDNVSYTEYESYCVNTSADGTEMNEIPMIDGECDGLSVVDYFGQNQGIDQVTYGASSLSGSDDTFGVDAIDTQNRRRTLSFWKKISRRVKKVVKSIVDIVNGDIDMRIFEQSLSIDASNTFSVRGSSSYTAGKTNIAYTGNFDINAGVDFYTGIYVDLEAKFKIFTKKPTFKKFRLVVGAETRFKAYAEVEFSGALTLEHEIARKESKRVVFIGPVPIIVAPYAAVSLGLTVAVETIPVTFSAQFGYEPIVVTFGVEWSGGKFKDVSTGFSGFKPIKNFGVNVAEESCSAEVVVAPFVMVYMGLSFYDSIDVYAYGKVALESEFEVPAICDSDIATRCDYEYLHMKHTLSLVFSFGLGMNINAKSLGLSNTIMLFELYSTDPFVIFEECVETDITTTEITDLVEYNEEERETCCGSTWIEEYEDYGTETDTDTDSDCSLIGLLITCLFGFCTC